MSDRSLEEMLRQAPSEITYNPIYGTVAAGSFPDKGYVYKLAETYPVQGEEFPELDEEYHRAIKKIDLASVYSNWNLECAKVECRERQLRAALAEIRRLNVVRDTLRTNGRKAITSIADSHDVWKDRAKAAELALSASRADALKEASECAAAYYSDDGFHPMLKNASACISDAILARMEKAS